MGDVPPELRGREASGRLIAPIFAAAEVRGIAPDVLAEGTGYPPAVLRDPARRVPWDACMRVFRNLGARASDEELVAIGASLLDTPGYRALFLPGRLLFSLPEIFRWGVRPESPLLRLVIVQDISVTHVSEHHLRCEAKLKPGYTCAREFWLVRRGFFESIPRAFGLPSARVDFEATEHGAVYDIRLPREKTVASRLRERASWIFAARDAAAALRRANDDLFDRNVELEAEVVARKLAEQRLRELNEALEGRIRERTQDLEAANRELAGANAELSMFSASIAHDLRTPLRAINGFASTVLEDHAAVLDADAKSQLGRVIAGAVRMGGLIDALLSLTRIARVEVRRERFDLGEIVHEVVEELRAVDPARKVEVVVDDAMVVEAHRDLVRAMLENLLGNAWKFTRDRPDARIEVRALRDVAADAFTVRDNGAGFDMMHADRLFTPFVRLHAAKAYDGSGIGLAVVDRVVRRHGGKLWVEASPGKGAAFSFTLNPR